MGVAQEACDHSYFRPRSVVNKVHPVSRRGGGRGSAYADSGVKIISGYAVYLSKRDGCLRLHAVITVI